MKKNRTIVGDLQAEDKSLFKLEKLFAMLETLGNDVLFLGDVLERRGFIEAKCLNFVYEKIKSSKLHFTILVGNHDLINLNGTETSLEPLKSLHNVNLIDKPTLNIIGNEGYLPYIHNMEALVAELNKFQAHGVEVVFAHLDVLGMDYGNGIKAPTGVDIGFLNEKFKLVISGHFHKFQQVNNFMYLGTPYSHDWGEANQEKFIMTYESPEKYELINTYEFFPSHISKVVDCDDQNLSFTASGFYRENYMKIILKGSQENIDKVKKYNLHDFKELGYLQAILIEEPTVDDARKRVVDETMSPEKQFETYCKEVVGADQETINLGLTILKEVK
jgi:hypothetical protein